MTAYRDRLLAGEHSDSGKGSKPAETTTKNLGGLTGARKTSSSKSKTSAKK